MQKLNFPAFPAQFEDSPQGPQIYDILRKKYVLLTPEEWVRQHLLHYLISHRDYPLVLIGLEKSLTVNRLAKRYDLLCYDRKGKPLLIAECKAPSVKLGQSALLQAASYNTEVNANILVLSNGMQTFCMQRENKLSSWIQVLEIPSFTSFI